MSRLDRVYARLPVWAQNLAVTGFGAYWHWLRFGPGYQRYLQEFRQRERFTQAEWHAWTHAQLIKLLSMAVDNVPYYSGRYSATEKAAARDGDLQALPLLEKDALRQDPRSFVRSDISRKETIYYTSGTTGTPITSIWTVAENRKATALREARSANWAGTSFRKPRATFSGRMVEPDPESKGPFYRFNAVENQVYFSAFHLKPLAVRQYVDALTRHNIEWLTGYAVSCYQLARYILDQGINAPPLAAVITTSEKLTEEMRAVMEQAYHCRIFEEYSTVENALFASECACGNLHVSPDAGIMEILRADGSPCDPDEVGEIVATCLFKDYQPLIRYRLGDLGSWSQETCACGRSMPVIREVTGRIEDLVIGPDGRQLVRFHGIFTNQPNILEGQVIQEATDRIRVKVVPASRFSQDDVADITSRVQQRLGKTVRVQVETVQSIPRLPSGKFQAVISQLRQAP